MPKIQISKKYILKDGTRYVPSSPEEYFKFKVKDIPHLGYQGLFAQEPIKKGSILAKGGGRVITSIKDIPNEYRYAVPLNEKLYIAPNDYSKMENFWYVNHSCKANCARLGLLVFMAKRNSHAGEQITIDYRPIVAGLKDWSMRCFCGETGCRKIITGDDWKNSEVASTLWQEMPPHIQKLMIKLNIL